ncbi:MAG TPA: BPL-N domain-containing protein [Pirellulales bacterium]|jgi:glutamine amidotransferase-like uncharacterized protein|nr:BPL-N domain-containing protein [Pirellulales bacterium]
MLWFRRVVFCCLLISAAPSALWGAETANDPSADKRPIRVAIYTVNQESDPESYRLLRERDDLQVTYLRGFDIRDDRLNDFDVLFVPGGSGSKQAGLMEEDGREKVRSFIRDGGGYMGICAGGYLATCHYDWGLKILDAETVDREHWARGKGAVEIELNDAGRSLLAADADSVTIWYGNGPILAPAHDDEIPDFEVLATYRTEVAKEGVAGGVMPNTPAAVRSTYGKGRVIVFSCHPDIPKPGLTTDGLRAWLPRMIYWAAARPGPSEQPAAIETPAK